MPAGPCCGPAFWNIQFNVILNLDCEKQTKMVTNADDVILEVKAENVREAENLTNIEMGKIINGPKVIKLTLTKTQKLR